MTHTTVTFVENKKKYYNILWTYNVLDSRTVHWRLYAPWKPFFFLFLKNRNGFDVHWSRDVGRIPKLHKIISLPQFVSEFSQL